MRLRCDDSQCLETVETEEAAILQLCDVVTLQRQRLELRQVLERQSVERRQSVATQLSATNTRMIRNLMLGVRHNHKTMTSTIEDDRHSRDANR